MLREESSWGMDSAGGAFNMLRSDSLLVEQYSPLSGDMKSPTTRARCMLLNSARSESSPSAGLLPGPGAMAMGGQAGNGLQRRSSRNSGGPLSATGLGPFGNLPPVSPLVTESSWGAGGLLDPSIDPSIDPDGIFLEPGSARSWARNMSGT
jgi:hypothetical protein